jgi:hypothetical protein
MARELYQLPANGIITGAGGTGWVYEADSAHTTGSRQTIAAGTRTLFTVDGLGGTTEESFSGTLPTDIWGTNTINPEAVGEVYMTRVGVTIAPTVVGDGYVELELDIGSGSQINILDRRLSLQKGSGIPHGFSAGFPIFCLTTFNNNGGKFYLTPSINVEVWNKSIFLQRTFSP